jgi:hypothetical protein
VADIFQEVDEEVRREQIRKLWDRYGILVVIAAFAVVAAVGGWRFYEWRQLNAAAQFGDAYLAAQTLADDGKHAEADAAFAKLSQDGSSGYRVLAPLKNAADLAATDQKAAVAAYDAISADRGVPQPLRDLATIRAALLLVDSTPLSDMTMRLEPLTGSTSTFRHTARELLALSAWRVGDTAAARRWGNMIMTDGETPSSMRQRVEVLMALLPPPARG